MAGQRRSSLWRRCVWYTRSNWFLFYYCRYVTTWLHYDWYILPNIAFRTLERFSYDLEMKTREQNRNNKRTEIERFDWFIERIQTRVAFWLVKRTLGWKNFMPENFLEINRDFALTSYCNMIGQLNNSFSILGFSLAGKWRVHVLIFSSTGW